MLVALVEGYDKAPVEEAATALGAGLFLLAFVLHRKGICERHPALQNTPDEVPAVRWAVLGAALLVEVGPVRAVLAGDRAQWPDLIVTRALELGHGRVVPVRDSAPTSRGEA